MLGEGAVVDDLLGVSALPVAQEELLQDTGVEMIPRQEQPRVTLAQILIGRETQWREALLQRSHPRGVMVVLAPCVQTPPSLGSNLQRISQTPIAARQDALEPRLLGLV